MTLKKTAAPTETVVLNTVVLNQDDPFETPVHAEGIPVPTDLGLELQPLTETAKSFTAAHGIGKLFGFAVIQAALHHAISFHVDGMTLGNGEKATCGIGGLNPGDYGKAYEYLKSLKNLLEIAQRSTGRAKGILGVVNTLLAGGLNTQSLVHAYDYFVTRGGSEFPLFHTEDFLDACEDVQETLSAGTIEDMACSRDNFELVFAPIAEKLRQNAQARREWARSRN